MINNKKLGLCMFLLIIFIMMVNDVNALGISPARKVIEFKPGHEENVGLEIINTEGKEMTLAVYVEGDLENNVVLSDSILEFKEGETSKSINYKVKLPDKFDVPGEKNTNIVIRQLQSKKALDGVSVGGTVAVVSQLRVNVPYPGKYATVQLRVSETGSLNKVDFIATVNSLGTQKIVNAKVIIDILGPTNEKITTIESQSFSLTPGLRDEIPLTWEGDINPGKYLAKLTLTYDGEIAKTEKIFNVGELELEIIDMYVNDFRLGDIAKFNILVQSNWADDFKGVFAEIIINDENDNLVANVKSANENVLALSKQEFTAFWDTKGVNEGTYNMKIILHYDEKTSELEVKAFVSLTSIEFDLFGGGTGAAITGGLPKESIYVIALVILVGLNIFWFAYFKRKGRKK